MLTLTWHPGAVVFPWPAGTGTRGPRPHTRQKAPPAPPSTLRPKAASQLRWKHFVFPALFSQSGIAEQPWFGPAGVYVPDRHPW